MFLKNHTPIYILDEQGAPVRLQETGSRWVSPVGRGIIVACSPDMDSDQWFKGGLKGLAGYNAFISTRRCVYPVLIDLTDMHNERFMVRAWDHVSGEVNDEATFFPFEKVDTIYIP